MSGLIWTMSLVVISILQSITPSLGQHVNAMKLQSFDLSHSHDDLLPRLVHALQEDGIISLAHIPGYANTRLATLESAIACFRSLDENFAAEFNTGDERAGAGAAGVTVKSMTDGATLRYTLASQLNSNSKTEENDGQFLKHYCPEYVIQRSLLSQLVDETVMNFTQLLDSHDDDDDLESRAQLAQEESESPVQLYPFISHNSTAAHLDHCHGYFKSSESRQINSTKTVPFHTDSGLFIAMTAPIFSVQERGEVMEKTLDSGLLIQTKNGSTLAPELPSDELILMIGEGFRSWQLLHSSSIWNSFHPVIHGMSMPEFSDDSPFSFLRAWFGKMILPPASLPLPGFGNLTRAQVYQQPTSVALACPHGRQLVASDATCLYQRNCVSKRDEDTDNNCALWCNRSHAKDKIKCAEKCTCAPEPSPGLDCWMLCNEIRPKECLAQECVDDKTYATCEPLRNSTQDPALSGEKDLKTSSSPKQLCLESTSLFMLVIGIVFMV